jgi:hypothetical protein
MFFERRIYAENTMPDAVVELCKNKKRGRKNNGRI